MKDKLTHTDSSGKASMVDVSGKIPQHREAWAEGRISLSKDTIMLIKQNQMKKGDVIALAEIAGIMGAKKTSDLIPLCHPLAISIVDVKIDLTDVEAVSHAYVKSTGPTGVEMEALTAVNVSLLTLYDMCKAVDKNMIIKDVRLIKKIKTDL